jgi:hypothetical protein
MILIYALCTHAMRPIFCVHRLQCRILSPPVYLHASNERTRCKITCNTNAAAASTSPKPSSSSPYPIAATSADTKHRHAETAWPETT